LIDTFTEDSVRTEDFPIGQAIAPSQRAFTYCLIAIVAKLTDPN